MVISALEECRKNKERVNVYTDGVFAFACYKDVAAEQRLHVGGLLSEEKMDEIANADGELYAIKTAMSYVVARPRTQRDIERKLKERDIAPRHMEKAIATLAEYGYISDDEYAEAYAKELSERCSKRMIKQKLLQKGIENSLAEAAVRGIDDTPLLARLYERYAERYAAEEERKRSQKIVRALMQKGFDYGDIQNVMENGYYED